MARRRSTSRASMLTTTAALAGGVRTKRMGKMRQIEQDEHPEVQWRHNPRVGLVVVHGGGYNGRSLNPGLVLFPVADKNEGAARLAKSSKTDLGENLVEACRGAVSLPSEPGPNGTVAMKIIGNEDIEGLRVVEVG